MYIYICMQRSGAHAVWLCVYVCMCVCVCVCVCIHIYTYVCKGLAPTQLSGLATTQLNALSTSSLATLSTSQLSGLSSAQLAALGGDAGARDIIAAHKNELVLIECDDPGVLQDIDRREDLTK